MAKILVRGDKTAERAAKRIANSRYGEAPKVKINKREFTELITMSYKIGEHNIIQNLVMLLKENKDLPIDELIGEFELLQVGVWNEIAQTRQGRTQFAPLYVEDLAMGKNLHNLFIK